MNHRALIKGLVIFIIILFIETPIINSQTLNILVDKKIEENVEKISLSPSLDYDDSSFNPKDSLFRTKDKFGNFYLSDITGNKSPYAPIAVSNYFDSDSNQFLMKKSIERSNRIIVTNKIEKNIGINNKVNLGKSNHYRSNIKLIKTSLNDYGNIFFVGGSGPNNFSSIQEAIDAAGNGDTIYVYNGTYYENLIIDKSINLIGQDKESTVISGVTLDMLMNTINVSADNVGISGFSINDNLGYYYQAAIYIVGDYATVSNCNIQNNDWLGIFLDGSSYSQIYGCEFYGNLISIYLIDSNENEMKNCFCYENTDDILLFDNSNNNLIINCTSIKNSFSGIHIQRSSGNQVVNCSCYDGYGGIGLAYAPNTKLKGNTINNNIENFGIGSSIISDFYCDIDTTNTINGKRIYYWINHHDEEIPAEAGFIGLISCSNILVKDIVISNNFQGIVCVDSTNCTMENCTFSNNGGHGGFFVSSKDNIIKNCYSSNCFFSGIYLVQQSNRNIVQNNTLLDIRVCGLWIEDSRSNHFSKHLITNSVKGISLDKSGDSVLNDNDMINCGIAVDGIDISDYINDVDTTNKVNGKIIYYYIDENGITIPSDAGQVILINCTNFNVLNLNLSDGTIGIELAYSNFNILSGNTINGNNMVAIDLDLSSNNHNTIKDNIIKNNNYGIDVDISDYNNFKNNIIHDNSVALSLDSSDRNVIVDNDILASWNSIVIQQSNNNHINNNTIQECGFNGIYLLYSKANMLKENEMVNCGLLVFGISLSEYINDVDTTNKVNGKTLYYYIDENGITIPSDAGQVILVNCANCNILNLDLSGGTIGIELAFSDFNTISKNTLNNNNFAGIYLESSSDNTVNLNTIENNAYGIDLQLADNNELINNKIQQNNYGFYMYLSNSNNILSNNCEYNTYGVRLNKPSNSNNIYHNNLIGNSFNAWDENEKANSWDDGKFGNYWSDYTTKYPDAKSKPLRPRVWDTPYEITEDINKDNNPMVNKLKISQIRNIKNNKQYHNKILLKFLEKHPNLFNLLKLMLKRL